MKLEQPLHLHFRNTDGPIDAYRAAEPWTREMQQDVQDTFARACEPVDLLSRRTARVRYRCPSCEKPQEEIRFESLVFFADDDRHQLHPVGQAQLITMADCGHQYRWEIAP